MDPARKRAVRTYRMRLGERGLTRFEVMGRDADRELIRSIARHLAKEGPEAARLRDAVSRIAADELLSQGGILTALRRSPLVGAELSATCR